MSRFWMVAYDIEDDRIRRKVHHTLKNYGTPVQYSVFECRLNQSRLNELRSKLLDLIAPQDTLRWYPLCKWCQEDIFRQGSGEPPGDDGFVIA
jgi:CRISPR-associated protein Cas2